MITGLLDLQKKSCIYIYIQNIYIYIYSILTSNFDHLIKMWWVPLKTCLVEIFGNSSKNCKHHKWKRSLKCFQQIGGDYFGNNATVDLFFFLALCLSSVQSLWLATQGRIISSIQLQRVNIGANLEVGATDWR